ncbi:sodium-dependent transporter [Alkalimonas collagenimarina]|uniref:Transporter n=1 Tax=Alkalimonas collagenimarina TaxID=400390 RepID=A0ABT9GW51_9GAMM|nr:sodium-dependent transporter [Alkalimonas collagenimarina]MDP4535271.1 sodium-dependent transporter [Alkalimonas collagenimarina]
MLGARESIHGQWSSRYAFILAATGAAVGLGNIWKFPYIMGENGGGAFVLVYLLCIVLIGIPVMMSEVLIGRRGRQSPGLSVKTLAQEANASTRWQIAGWSGLVASYLILSFYAVVAGWALAYVFKTARGDFSDVSADAIGAQFGAHLADPWLLMTWSAVILFVTVFVVAKGVHKGLEKAVNFLMPSLFVLLAIMAIYSGMNGAFGEAAEFMFKPDFSKLTINGVLLALGHAFFTLSLASGAMIIYGAYLPANVSIAKTSMLIALVDTCVAIVAGLAIYPLVFQYGLTPSEGPGLIFVTLPIAFGSMPFGTLFGTLFFVMLVFAAFTSAIAMIESTVAWLVERKGLSRLMATVTTGGSLWLVGLLTVFSFSGAGWATFTITIFGKTLSSYFEVVDYLTSAIMLPLGGLAVAIFVGWTMKRKVTVEELNTSALAYGIWRFAIRWFTPIAVAVVFLHLIGVLDGVVRFVNP